MDDRSVTAGGTVSHSIVVTGDGNHASIHFGEGVVLPLARQQRLSKRHRKPTAENLLPLLRADSLAFDLVGREEELTELRAWLDSDADISVQTLIGRAGTGKTRLAIELCRQVDGTEKPGESGWRAGFLRPADITNVVDQLATRPLMYAEPILLVIDYASAVHRELARWLDRLAASAFDGRLRFLLLDREAPEGFGWWHDLTHPALSGDRAGLFVDPDRPRRLSDLSDLTSRRAVFDAAVKATADLLGRRAVAAAAPADGADQVFDAALAEERFGNPLNLAMAGLIAAERDRREALVLRSLEAARYIARREVKRMELLGEGCRPPIPAAAMRHSLGFNGLVGGLRVATLRAELTAELREAGFGAALDELPALLERELPQEGREADDGAEPRLGTVQPDLVGEGVIVEAFLTGPANQLAAAANTFQRACALGGGRAAEALMRLLQDYGYAVEDPEAGQVQRKTGESLLFLLSAVAESIPDEEFLRLESLVFAFPLNTLVLREAAAAQTQRLATIYKTICNSIDRSDDEAFVTAEDRRGMSMIALGLRLSDVGRHEEALEAVQEAVELYRGLAAARAEAFNPHVSMSLSNLAKLLSDLGRHEEALDAAKEAVELDRQLVAAQPDAFAPGLSASLSNLARVLSELGGRDDAVEAAQQAVELDRRLAAARPDAFTPRLAASLTNLGGFLADLGRHKEALRVAQEAVDIRRRLVASQPDAFAPDLAVSLNNLANFLSDLGRPEAFEVAQEAVDIRRRLAAARPDAFTAAFAMSLNNFANRLGDLGRGEEALDAAQEAVELCRRLAAARPDALRPDLAMSLTNLANRLSEHGRHEEALEVAQEAVDIRRRLAAVRPDAFTPDLARSLAVLGLALHKCGDAEQAVQSGRASVACLSPGFLQRPPVFASLMSTLVSYYLQHCERAGVEPDLDLLRPILDQFGSMNEEQG